MRRCMSLLAAATALVVVGCGGGGGGKTTTTPHQAMTKVKVCSGLTDKCHTATLPAGGGQYRLAPRSSPTLSPSSHCHIVDVSDYQGGSLNWGSIGKYVCGGVTKAGESTCSTCGGNSFSHNWTGMRAAHLWHSAYWFVRPGNCTAQARLFVSRLNSVGYKTDKLAGRPDLDEEVPGSNQTACMASVIWKAFHRRVDVYTSPGTWPGGSHPGADLWQAEYGSSLHPVWTPVVAWQCTDGTYGCKTYVPGIGYSDVSQNLGITKEAGATTPAPKPKPPSNPHCFGKHPDSSNKTCKSQRARVAQLYKYLRVSLNHLRSDKCLLVWVRPNGQVATGVKDGPVCSRISHNASNERVSIAKIQAKYH